MHSILVTPLRRPLLAAITKPAAARSLITRHLSTTQRTALPKLAISKATPQTSKIVRQLPSKRFFTTEPAIVARPNRQETIKRVAYGAAIFGGTLLAINVLFNHETRQGAIPEFEHQYLKETFTYTGLGVGIIGAAAKGLHNMGWSFRLMSMNPWLVMGVGLVGSIGTMVATRMTDPDNYVQKHALWAAFNVTQGALLAPMFFYAPAILARAGLYTVGIMGSISYVAATAKEDKYLWLGGPLLAGCTVVALSSFAPLVLPVGSRMLAGAEALWLYGGLAVMGGFTLWDVQKIQHHARLAQQGYIKKDAVNESIGLTLDFINIFVRMVYILQGQKNKK